MSVSRRSGPGPWRAAASVRGQRAGAAGYYGSVLGAADLPNIEGVIWDGIRQAHGRARASARLKGVTRRRYPGLGDSIGPAKLAHVEAVQATVPATYTQDPRSVPLGDAVKMAVDGFRKLGKATPHDEVVADGLAEVLSGGDTDVTEVLSEDQLLDLERTSFMKLIRHPGTIARVEHMLETGKPLRN